MRKTQKRTEVNTTKTCRNNILKKEAWPTCYLTWRYSKESCKFIDNLVPTASFCAQDASNTLTKQTTRRKRINAKCCFHRFALWQPSIWIIHDPSLNPWSFMILLSPHGFVARRDSGNGPWCQRGQRLSRRRVEDTEVEPSDGHPVVFIIRIANSETNVHEASKRRWFSVDFSRSTQNF